MYEFEMYISCAVPETSVCQMFNQNVCRIRGGKVIYPCTGRNNAVATTLAHQSIPKFNEMLECRLLHRMQRKFWSNIQSAEIIKAI